MAHDPKTFTGDQRATIRERFAAVASGGGKFVGHEVVGYKRLASRHVKLYTVTYFEKVTLVVEVMLVETLDRGWRIATLVFNDTFDGLEKVTPLTPLGEK